MSRPADSDDRIAALLFEPFELWWAAHEDPSLQSVPLVSIREGRVVHANPAARQEGVTPGLQLAGARLKTSHLKVIDSSAAQLQTQWSWQLERLQEHSPWLTGTVPGRAWIRLSITEARQLAAALRVQAGASDHRETALAAALMARPGELRIVPAGTEAAFLHSLPLDRLPRLGFSRQALVRFTHLGISRLGDLRHWKETQLRSVIGQEALRLHRLLHGPWDAVVPPFRPPATITASFSFSSPATEPWQLEPVVRQLAARTAGRLTGRTASRITVTAESMGMLMPAERLPKEPVHGTDGIVRLAWQALQQSGAPSLGVDRLTLSLGGLAVLQEQQELWPQRAARQQAVRFVSGRFPGALLGYELLDPYSVARDRRYRLVRLDTGESVSRAPASAPAPVREMGVADAAIA